MRIGEFQVMHDAISPQSRLARRTFIKGALSFAAALSLGSVMRPTSAAAAPPPSLDPLSNFVPRQICVVVSTDAKDPTALYYGAMQTLNEHITRLVRAATPPTASDIATRELSPHSLKPYLPNPDDGKTIVPWLVPLVGALDAWIVLDPPVGNNIRQVLLYYGVGINPVAPDDDATVVRRPINVINMNLRFWMGYPGGDFHVDGATPNWYVVTASDETCGGPGGKNESAPAGGWRLKCSDRVLDASRAKAAIKASGAGGSSVILAIIDTCPDPAAVSFAQSNYPSNWLLTEVKKSVHIGQAPSLRARDAAPSIGPNGPRLPNWYGAEQATGLSIEEFSQADHGLMVAGLARDAAPGAEIHLIRALGDYGVGTLQGLTYVLNKLQSTLNPLGKKRMIVNLSLMIDLPASYRIMQRWFPGSTDPVPESSIVRTALGLLDSSIRASMDALNRQNVLVVAAAGNDSLPIPGARRPLPRYPARLPNVLSVAAVKSDGSPASYSNMATVSAFSAFGAATTNGIAVLGGEAALHSGWYGPLPVPQPVGSAPRAPGFLGPRFIDMTGRPDAVVGISSSKVVTMSSVRNPTSASPTGILNSGWVYWAGTSFAAPIISGLAGSLWELDPTLPAQAPLPGTAQGRGGSVASAIQSYATGQVTDLGCGLLSVKQG